MNSRIRHIVVRNQISCLHGFRVAEKTDSYKDVNSGFQKPKFPDKFRENEEKSDIMYMSLRTENQMFNLRKKRFKHREFFMKKIKFLSLIAILAVICLFITSCEFGGSLTITNQTLLPIIVNVVPHIDGLLKTIPANRSDTWNFDIDTDVSWEWYGAGSEALKTTGKVSIKGGANEVIIAK
jgi:hypothetical protein